MTGSRIDDLRRRLEKDPSSIAFAQLAEEYRRAGELQLAIGVCRAGLLRYPDYASARVTLGRALMALNDLDRAEHELRRVLKRAPDNLAAVRGLAEIHARRQPIPDMLKHAPVDRPRRIVAALERWLAAIHVARAQHST